MKETIIITVQTARADRARNITAGALKWPIIRTGKIDDKRVTRKSQLIGIKLWHR